MEMTRKGFVASSVAGVAAAGIAAAGVASGAVSLAGAEEAAESGEPAGTSEAAGAGESAAVAAGAAFEWPGAEPVVDEGEIVETVETEVLVCGAGHAGMIAALSASTEGARTLVIERNKTVGKIRSYIGAFGSRTQAELGVEFDRQEAVNDLVRYASGRCDQRLINMWAYESGDALNWLEEQVSPYGIEMRAEPAVGEGYEGVYKRGLCHHRPILSTTASHTAHFSETGACNTLEYWETKLDQSELSGAIVELAEQAGAEFRFETTLVKLIKEEGAVTGAIARNAEGGYLRINASKGVILCCGGYEADPEAYAALNPADESGTTLVYVQEGCDGSGIRAGIWAGGKKDDVPTAMLFDRGGVTPGTPAGAPYLGYPVWYGSQPFLKLDLDGKRFANEVAPYDVTLHMLSNRKGRLEAMLWDANAWAEIEAFDTISCSRLVLSPTEPPTYEGVGEDVFWGWVQEGVEMGLVFRCDTLEELVERLQLPAEQALASIARYNELAAAGEDTDFGKPARDLFALENPPYYGVILGSWLLCTLDGLIVDEDCRVMDGTTGDPIPGLYACGDNSGAFFSNNYPELYPGVAAGRGMTEARHATLHALGKLA